MEIEVKDRLIDNDPRMAGRELTVIAVGVKVIVALSNQRKSRIRKDRIFLDGKQRKYGFNLVKHVPF